MRSAMQDDRSKQLNRPELIALPPLKMVLAHINDTHVSRAALVAAIRKISLQPVAIEMNVDRQTVKRFTRHLLIRSVSKMC